MAKLGTLIRDCDEAKEKAEYLYPQVLIQAAMQLLLAAEAYTVSLDPKTPRARIRECYSLLAQFPVGEQTFRLNACDETDPRFLMLNALKVFTLDANIRTFLESTDPKALEQAREAIEAFENREIPTKDA